jgi:uncharacterized protein (DUF1697 family)
MALFGAFLRGMNVGGHRITNADLRAEFETLGFESVATFRASGNVVFESKGQSEAKLQAKIEKGLEEGLGYAVPTFIRTAAELEKIAASEPFEAKAVEASKGKLQVLLLSKSPSKTNRDKVSALATDRDLLAFGKRELFWLPSGGTLESELDFKLIEKLVGQTTTRTLGTLEQLAGKFVS